MKVTILYHIAFTHPHPQAVIRKWEGELSEAEYNIFKQYRSENRGPYNDIREEYHEADDAFRKDNSAQEELNALNYEILREALPQWCDYAVQDIIDEQEEYHVRTNLILDVSNVHIDGCRFG